MEGPVPILDLVERAHREGAEVLTQQLGPFVLVGSIGEGADDAWSFATHSVVSPLEAGAQEPGFDIDRSVVYPLAKRLTTFPDTILVGRSSSNDVRIDHTAISKLHARIKLEGDFFWVEDAGSRNGTFVDGERVGVESAVHPGDTIRFGSLSFRVHRTERFIDLLRRIRP
jgi:hypothetical protein